MSRLTSEFDRLFTLGGATAQTPTGRPLLSPEGLTRALVLGLASPAEWPPLAGLWQAAQEELGLPAPAIAIDGTTSFQLWFSLEQPVPADQAQAFLKALSRRYLPGVPAGRLRLWPQSAGAQAVHAEPIPTQHGDEGRWSSFVAPDLAPVFGDAPYLDIPPSPEGQADLLMPLRSIRPAELARALEALQTPSAKAQEAKAGNALAKPAAGTPAEFLLRVMNDESVDLRIRVEAAKALLPYYA
ncbi:hypothetical protein [Hydrogenophaga aquatica]